LKKVSSETEAQDFIKAVKKEFWDATHNCSAYIIDELAQRSSDDGEPSGTAGLPMLEVLRKNQLSGVAAVVTRYFGGIKLGAGGLVRAYTGSVSKAVQRCGLARKILMGTFALSADAADAGKLLNIIYQQQLFTVASVEYGQQARILLYMKQEQQDEAERWLTEALNMATQLEQVGCEYVEVPAEREK
jgi:IMPACT family member yvyE